MDLFDLCDQDEHSASGIPSRIVRAGCRHPQVMRGADGVDRCLACKRVVEPEKPKKKRPAWLPKKTKPKGEDADGE